MTALATTADLFRATWPKDTAKRVEAAANSPWETARRWMKRRSCPPADTLLRMVQHDPNLRANLMRLLEDLDAAMVEHDRRGVAAATRDADRIAGQAAVREGIGAAGPGGPAGASPDVAAGGRGRA